MVISNTFRALLTQVLVEKAYHTGQIFLSVVCEGGDVARRRGQPQGELGIFRAGMLGVQRCRSEQSMQSC